MNTKKMGILYILLAITIVVYVIASVLFCYTTKPEISRGEFPFSYTYEYKGETKTISGVYVCEYSGSYTIHDEHKRYWKGEAFYDYVEDPENPHIIEQNDELMTTLSIQENMEPGYFMGDPLHKDHYAIYGLNGPEPYIQYYDYKNDIYLDSENRDEVLESIGFKVIETNYPEPIENSFSFSGISYEADNVIIFIAVMLVFLLLCIIFVRKDKEHKYSILDKLGIILNFIVGIFALPFISITCMLFGIVESNVELLNQIIYNIPSVTILCLALSIVFRRKGFSNTGFWIQFAGPLLYVLSLVADTLF